MDGASTEDVAHLRHEYSRAGLVESDLTPEPYAMFERWFGEARSAGIGEPNAMVLATASAQGVPSSRMVLLKGVRPGPDGGFRFFTNTASRKGEELAAQARCALLLPWHPLERQVRIDGLAEPLAPAEVAQYFAERPHGSRLGAWASPQSREVASREELAERYAAVEERFGDEVPVPPDWGGYLVRPLGIEYWQGRPGRMHDRLVYTRPDIDSDDWSAHRLAP